MIDVVVGLVFNEQNQVLVARRQKHQSSAGKLEFPGGKVDQGEPYYDALCREFDEEVAIKVLNAKEVLKIPYHYEDQSVCLHVWQIENYHGAPHGNEGQEVFFADMADLSAADFPEANAKILDFLSAM